MRPIKIFSNKVIFHVVFSNVQKFQILSIYQHLIKNLIQLYFVLNIFLTIFLIPTFSLLILANTFVFCMFSLILVLYILGEGG